MPLDTVAHEGGARHASGGGRPSGAGPVPCCRAVFIIDDRVELAGRLHADGVHLGKADMPVRGGPAPARAGVPYRRNGQYVRGCPYPLRGGRRLYRLRPVPLHHDQTETRPHSGARRIPGHNRPYAGGGHRPARGGHRWCDGRGYVCPGQSRTQRYCAQRERIACRRPGGRDAEGHADCETSFR